MAFLATIVRVGHSSIYFLAKLEYRGKVPTHSMSDAELEPSRVS
mgnify:CR=1 FL=1